MHLSAGDDNGILGAHLCSCVYSVYSEYLETPKGSSIGETQSSPRRTSKLKATWQGSGCPVTHEKTRTLKFAVGCIRRLHTDGVSPQAMW
jgi:hypothetical protein